MMTEKGDGKGDNVKSSVHRNLSGVFENSRSLPFTTTPMYKSNVTIVYWYSKGRYMYLTIGNVNSSTKGLIRTRNDTFQ